MKRYRIGWFDQELEEDPNGGYVDYDEAQAEIDRLKTEIETLRAALVLADARINDLIGKTK